MLGIYCRISKEKEEGKDRSINDQKLLGIELSKSLKIPYQIYIDEGISGTNEIKDRPQFSKLLEDIEEGIITHVYSYDQSRLERNPQVRFVLKKLLKENNIQLYTDSGQIDLHDDESEMFGDIISIMNSYYVRMTKKKIKSVIKRNVSLGKIHGLPPYGYTHDENNVMVIDKKKSKVIKKIYELNLKGWGQNKIKEYLIQNKIPNDRNGKNWGKSTVGQILRNPVYKGVRIFGGEIYESPKIIETELWQNVQNNKNVSGKGNNYKYLLNNSLTCGKCGSRYTGRYLQKQNNYYRCVTKQYKGFTCNNRGITQPIIEQFIWDRFFVKKHLEKVVTKWFNNSPKNKLEEIEKMINSIQNEITTLQRRRSRAISLTIDGTLTKDDVKSELKKIDNKIEELRIQLQNQKETESVYENSKSKFNDLNEDMNNIYFDTSFDMKQEFIKKWIKDIKIDYEKPYYQIIVEFNLPDSKKETYDMETKYRWVFDYDTGDIVWGKNYPIRKRTLS